MFAIWTAAYLIFTAYRAVSKVATLINLGVVAGQAVTAKRANRTTTPLTAGFGTTGLYAPAVRIVTIITRRTAAQAQTIAIRHPDAALAGITGVRPPGTIPRKSRNGEYKQ
jgi:hypothetical protein